MYTFDGRVRYSEVDHQGKIKLSALINYFQDCSTFQSEDIGLGVKVLRERNKVWILSYWQVVVERFPMLGEEIQIGTFASGFKGVYGDRNFIMLDKQEHQIACANSVWVFMDLERGRPVKPEEEDIKPYGMKSPLDMQYEGRKIARPEKMEHGTAFPVKRYHIDTNEHVNNCQYVQMAMEQLPDTIEIKQMRVEYKKSAVYGDIIYPQIAVEGNRTVVELCDREKRTFALVEFK